MLGCVVHYSTCMRISQLQLTIRLPRHPGGTAGCGDCCDPASCTCTQCTPAWHDGGGRLNWWRDRRVHPRVHTHQLVLTTTTRPTRPTTPWVPCTGRLSPEKGVRSEGAADAAHPPADVAGCCPSLHLHVRTAHGARGTALFIKTCASGAPKVVHQVVVQGAEPSAWRPAVQTCI